VIGVSTVGAITTRWVDEANTTGQGGIWQDGAGLAEDADGDLIVGAGNGPTPPLGTPGTAPGQTSLGNGVIRLHAKANGTLHETDFFAPYDSAWLSGMDLDFASGGVVLLPSSMGSTATPNLAVTVDKAGSLYLLDRDDLGGIASGPNGADAVVDRLDLDGRIWSTPAVWPGDGGLLYVTMASTKNRLEPLVAVQVTQTGGKSGLSIVGSSAPEFTGGSGSPSVSSVGTTDDSAVVWVTRCSDSICADTSLDAYDAEPVDGQMVEIGSWPLAAGTKYAQPLIWHGKVYVGDGDNIFCLGAIDDPAGSAGFVSGTAVSGVQSAMGSIQVTPAAPVTIRSVTFGNPAFSVSAGALSALATTPSASPSIPVDVSASKAGEITTTVRIATSAGVIRTTAAVDVEPAGPLLKESQFTDIASMGAVAPTAVLQKTYPLTNIGTEPITITGVTEPASPFSVDSSIQGQVIEPGASIPLTLSVTGGTFSGVATGSLTVTTTGGTATWQLSAISGTS
jgi:hypothetical protein